MHHHIDDDWEASQPTWIAATANQALLYDDEWTCNPGSIPEALRMLGMLEIERCPIPAIAIFGTGVTFGWKSWRGDYLSATGFNPKRPGHCLIKIIRGGKSMPWIDCTILGLRKALLNIFPTIRSRWLDGGDGL